MADSPEIPSLAAVHALRWTDTPAALNLANELAGQDLDEDTRNALDVERALLLHLLGRGPDSLDLLDAILARLEPDQAPVLWIQALNIRGGQLLADGEAVEATSLFTAAWHMAHRHTLPRRLLQSAANLSHCLERLGAYDTAAQMLADSIDAAADHPQAQDGVPSAQHNRVRMLHRAGQVAQARSLLEAERAAMLAHPRLGAARVRALDAELCLAEGDFAAAEAHATAALQPGLPPGYLIETRMMAAQAALGQGKAAPAIEALAGLAQEAAGLAPQLSAEIRRSLAAAHEAAGQPLQALALWREEAQAARSATRTQLAPAIQRLAARHQEEVDHLRLVELKEARDALVRQQDTLHQALAQAEHEAELRQRLLAEMSHELRTPLHAVVATIDALLATEGPPSRAILARLRTPAELTVGIVDDILEMGRLEAGRLPLDPRPTRMAEVLRRPIDLLEARAAAQGTRLHLSLGPRVATWASIDARRLEQILVNLVGNAVKFTPGGKVELAARASERGDQLLLAVHDEGPGVPEALRAHIFQPWAQGSRATFRHYGGSGLGLPIAARLTRELGGEIGVEGRQPQGSTFWVRLPLRPCPPPGAAAQSLVVPLLALDPPLHVLVVEDEPMGQEVVRELFQSLGVRVQIAGSGAEALAASQDSPHDLLLIDLGLPDMDGRALLTALRAQGETRPIVAFSAAPLASDPDAARAAGFDDVLPKPTRRKTAGLLFQRWVGRLRD